MPWMVIICAWCERYLGARAAEPMITHAICEPCAARQRWQDTPMIVVARHRAEIHPVLQQLLRGEPAIRIVIDRRVGDRRQGRAEPDPTGERRRDPDRRRGPADAMLA